MALQLAGFMGLYENSIDKKNRIVIPQVFRTKFKTIDSTAENPKENVIVVMDYRQCFRLYTEEEYSNVFYKIKKLIDEGNPSSEVLRRQFMEQVWQMEPDANGRISLSGLLREKIGATNGETETLAVGSGNHVEIWLKENYMNKTFEYDAIREAFREAGEL